MEIQGADGGALHSILAQPKRQGLLAYLAVASPRGYQRRDTLVGLLWPNRNEEHARNALSKAASHLRTTLGADVVVSRGHAELGLDWQHLWCDAAAFEDALDRGNPAEAMELYRGELLPGFFVDECPEFEQWLERTRSRLRGRALQAARQLSEREELAGRLDTAVEWLRRAATLDPFDESALRRLMTLLEQMGDRAGAIRAYDEFAARLKAELDTGPAPETAATLAAVREGESRGVIVPASVAASPRAPSVPMPKVASAPVPLAVDASARSAPLMRNNWRVTAIAVAAIAVVAIAARFIAGRGGSSSGASRAPTVAVLPFVVQGAASAEYLSDGMVTLLSERFNQGQDLHALDSRRVRSIAHAIQPSVIGADSARELLAALKPRFVIVGRVTAFGDSLRINASLFDTVAGSDPLARAGIEGKADSVAMLAAEVAWQIVTQQPASGARRVRNIVGALTPSFAAMRAYLTGEYAYNSGRFAEAATAYKAAVDADTTFAIAYLSLANAANWNSDYPTAQFGLMGANRYIDRLSIDDQLRVRTLWAYETGQPLEAERLARLVLANDINTPDAWYMLGEVRFHFGPNLGMTQSEAREAYERSLSGSARVGTMEHLIRIAAADGRTQRLDSLVTRAIDLGVDGGQAIEIRLLHAYAHGDRAAATAEVAAASRLDDGAAFSAITQVAAFAAEHEDARGATEALRLPRRSMLYRTVGTVLDAGIVMAHGRRRDAERTLARGDVTAARSLEYRAAMATLPLVPSDLLELRSLRDSIQALRPDPQLQPDINGYAADNIYLPRRLYLLGMISLRLGDTAAVNQIIAELSRTDESPERFSHSRSVAAVLRAELLRARRKPKEALAALLDPRDKPEGALPNVLHYNRANERFLRAELNREAGNPREALRWYGTFPDPGAYDMMYLPAVRMGEGAAYEQLGDTAAARASYERVALLYADADAELQPVLVAARAKVAALKRP